MDDRKRQVIEALSECYGIVTDACRKTNVARSTFYNWVNEDPEFKSAVEDIQEETLDFVEGQLHKQIANGEVSSTIFYLKTKGKKRGYIEKQEMDLNHSGGVQIVFEKAVQPNYETK